MFKCYRLPIAILYLCNFSPLIASDVHPKQVIQAHYQQVDADWTLFLSAKSGPELDLSAPISYVFFGVNPQGEVEKIPAIVKTLPQTENTPEKAKNILVVSPSSPLDTDKIWMLRFESPDGNEKNLRYTLENWYPQRITALAPQIETFIYSRGRSIHLNWNIPTLGKERENIFRNNIHFESNGVRSLNCPDGVSKTLNINGKILTFTLTNPTNKKDNKDNDERYIIHIQGEPVFEGRMIINAGIPSEDGQVLKSDKEFPVRLGINNPHLWVLSAHYLPQFGHHNIPIFTDYISSATLNLKYIPNQDAPHFFSSWTDANNKKKDTWHDILNAMPNASKEELSEWRSAVNRPLNITDIKGEQSYTFQWKPSAYKEIKELTLPQITNNKNIRSGLYVLDLTGIPSPTAQAEIKQHGYPNNDLHIFPDQGKAKLATQLLIQVTDIGCLWKQASKESFFYLYSLKTGLALKHSRIRFLSGTGDILTEKNTNNAIISTEVPPKTKALMLIHGTDQCLISFPSSLTKNTPQYIKSASQPTSSPLYPLKRHITFITNKYCLEENKTFHLKAIMRGNDGKTLSLMPPEKCFLSIFDPQGNTIYSEEAHWDEYGCLDLNFPIPPKIQVETVWNDTSLPRFKLKPHKKGDYTVTLYFPRNGSARTEDEDSPVTQQNTPFTSDQEYYEQAQRYFETSFSTQQKTSPISTDKPPIRDSSKKTETSLNFTTEKPIYTLGEKAKIIFQEPIEGEILITFEREDITHSETRTLTHSTTSIDLNLPPQSIPNVFVSISQLSNTSTVPRWIKNSCEIIVKKPETSLNIQLNETTSLPDSEKRQLQGSVCDHLDKPMPDAEVLLYIEPQCPKKNAKSPTRQHLWEIDFYPPKTHRVRTGSSLHLFQGKLKHFDIYGIHEGDAEYFNYTPEDNLQEESSDNIDSPSAREPHPPSQWINHLRTDHNGKFSTTWTAHANQTYNIHATAISKGSQLGSTIQTYPTTQDNTNKPNNIKHTQ